jgi:hypothetical protein
MFFFFFCSGHGSHNPEHDYFGNLEIFGIKKKYLPCRLNTTSPTPRPPPRFRVKPASKCPSAFVLVVSKTPGLAWLGLLCLPVVAYGLVRLGKFLLHRRRFMMGTACSIQRPSAAIMTSPGVQVGSCIRTVVQKTKVEVKHRYVPLWCGCACLLGLSTCQVCSQVCVSIFCRGRRWVVEGFSSLPVQRTVCVTSSPFQAGGCMWELFCHDDGHNDSYAGCVSMCESVAHFRAHLVCHHLHVLIQSSLSSTWY